MRLPFDLKLLDGSRRERIAKLLIAGLVVLLLFYLIGPDGSRDVQIKEITVTNYFFKPPQ